MIYYLFNTYLIVFNKILTANNILYNNVKKLKENYLNIIYLI